VTLRTLPDAHRLKWGENTERTCIVNSTGENTANFCTGLDGKPLLSALYRIYIVILNELKAVLKVSVQAGQRDIVNKTPVESKAQDEGLP
jgi:hypothetical protein